MDLAGSNGSTMTMPITPTLDVSAAPTRAVDIVPLDASLMTPKADRVKGGPDTAVAASTGPSVPPTPQSSAPLPSDIPALQSLVLEERSRRARLNENLMRIRSKVSEEVTRLEGIIAAQEAQLREVSTSNALLKEEAALNEELLKRKEDALAHVSREMQHAVFGRECMQGDVDELTSQVAEANARVQALKASRDKWKRAAGGATSTAADGDDEDDEGSDGEPPAVQVGGASAAELASALARVDTVSRSLQEALGARDNLTSEVSRLTVELEAAQRLRDEAVTAQTALESRLSAEALRFKDALADEKLSRAHVVAEVVALKSDRAALQREVAQLRSAAAASTSTADAVTAATDRATLAETAATVAARETEALRRQVAETASALAAAEAAKAAVSTSRSAEIEALTVEVRALHGQLVGAETGRARAVALARAAEDDVAALRLKLSAEGSARVALDGEVAALRLKLGEEVAAHRAAEDDLGKATEYGRVLLASNRELQAQLKSVRSGAGVKSDDAAATTDALATAMRELQTALAAHGRLMADVQQSSSRPVQRQVETAPAVASARDRDAAAELARERARRMDVESEVRSLQQALAAVAFQQTNAVRATAVSQAGTEAAPIMGTPARGAAPRAWPSPPPYSHTASPGFLEVRPASAHAPATTAPLGAASTAARFSSSSAARGTAASAKGGGAVSGGATDPLARLVAEMDRAMRM